MYNFTQHGTVWGELGLRHSIGISCDGRRRRWVHALKHSCITRGTEIQLQAFKLPIEVIRVWHLLFKKVRRDKRDSTAALAIAISDRVLRRCKWVESEDRWRRRGISEFPTADTLIVRYRKKKNCNSYCAWGGRYMKWWLDVVRGRRWCMLKLYIYIYICLMCKKEKGEKKILKVNRRIKSRRNSKPGCVRIVGTCQRDGYVHVRIPRARFYLQDIFTRFIGSNSARTGLLCSTYAQL